MDDIRSSEDEPVFGLSEARAQEMTGCETGMHAAHRQLMRASLVGLAAMMTAIVASFGCSPSADPLAGEASSNVISQAKERQEFECNLTDGRIIRVYPAYGEMHEIDPKWATWSMKDGLDIEVTNLQATIKNDEGKTIATITSHGFYAEVPGEAMPQTGPCTQSWVKDLAPTSAPVVLDESLEYDCQADGNEGVDFAVRPKAGEVDMIRINDGRFYALREIAFESKSIETSPAKNVISGKTTDGSPVEIVETENGIRITESQITGSCEKHSRRSSN